MYQVGYKKQSLVLTSTSLFGSKGLLLVNFVILSLICYKVVLEIVPVRV